MSKKIILIYSGGLDTTVCIPILKEKYAYEEIVTLTIDIGQPKEEIKQAEKKAKLLKCKHYTVDAKQEFINDYIIPAVKSNALYEGYPVSTSIARPLISKKSAELGKKLNIKDFGHGCTGKGNDQFRIEFALRALMPDCNIIAPVRELNLTRIEELDYAEEKGIEVSQSKEKIYSIDENLWGRSIEGGRLEESDFISPEEIYLWTKSIENANSKPQKITIEFNKGEFVSLNKTKLSSLNLITKLHKIAGDNGVGRIDIMEDRIVGLKVRENYECPAAIVLLTAHKALENLILSKEEIFFKEIVDREWSKLAYDGLLFHPLRYALDGFIEETQKRISGEVTLQLYRGNVKVVARKSKYTLSDVALSSFDTKDFVQSEMTGMVKNYGLQALVYNKQKENK